MKHNHLDLFSGIGGFALAAQRTEWTTIGFSEIEPYACKLLKQHWPDVPNYGDITKWRDWPDLGDVSLITGGFPCQPFSCAGKRRGTRDDRFLWPAMLDVIGRYKPDWVLGENVPGLIGMELDRCLTDLEGIGFRTATLVVPACAVDARHRRDRVWIVAYSVRTGGQQITGSSHGDEATNEGRSTSHNNQPASNGEGHSERLMADANKPGPQGWNGQELRECGTQWTAGPSGSSLADTMCEGSLPATLSGIHSQQEGTGTRNVESERCCEWQPEPELGRVAHGIPNRAHRLKGLGNAIVPQVAEVFLRAIRQR